MKLAELSVTVRRARVPEAHSSGLDSLVCLSSSPSPGLPQQTHSLARRWPPSPSGLGFTPFSPEAPRVPYPGVSRESDKCGRAGLLPEGSASSLWAGIPGTGIFPLLVYVVILSSNGL